MTMTFIGSSGTVGAGGVSSILFSSIPSTFTHLQIRLFVRDNASAASNYMQVRINGDTGFNYSNHFLNGNGASTASSGFANENQIYIGDHPANNAAANLFGVYIFDFLDYANTNKNKTVRVLNGFDANGSGQVRLHSSAWFSTSAINSIEFRPFNGATLLVAGSRADLYGIGVSEQTGA